MNQGEEPTMTPDLTYEERVEAVARDLWIKSRPPSHQKAASARRDIPLRYREQAERLLAPLLQALKQRDERIEEAERQLVDCYDTLRDIRREATERDDAPAEALATVDNLARSTLQQNTPKESK